MTPFVRKLRHGSWLTAQDEAVLDGLAWPERHVERGDIAVGRREPRCVTLVLKGWVCRYKQLQNGKRQILSLFVPGDLCGPFGALPRAMDHTLVAITPAVLGCLPVQALRDAARDSPGIEEALWQDQLLAEAVLREHLVSVGRRSATERLGHFFCELHTRLSKVGLADRSSCEFPLTQSDLADMFGLSAVHVNRSLQELRGGGLIGLRERRLTILRAAPLYELAMFDPAYLGVAGSVGP